jgi:hypothetical protein
MTPAFVLAALVADPSVTYRIAERVAPDSSVLVFRHHPAILGTNSDARSRDWTAILKALAADEISYTYAGGLGKHGYELTIRAGDLSLWVKAVDRLIREKKLEDYGWGLDRNGFGIVPMK